MNKLVLLSLLLSSTVYALLPAKDAHNKALDSVPRMIQFQANYLLDEINTCVSVAMDTGGFQCTIDVKDYNDKVLNIVTAKLTNLGYTINITNKILYLSF